jgi:hypothetical protein
VAVEDGPPDVDLAVLETQDPLPDAPVDDTKKFEPTIPEPQAEKAESSLPTQPGPEDPPAPLQVDDASKGATEEEQPPPELVAPPSPALSKGSSKRRQEGWTRQRKVQIESPKAIDHVDSKRSHRSNRTESGAREERHRSRRHSMTMEEDAERRRRRRAREAEEEAARERKRAEDDEKRRNEDERRRLREKIEKAMVKAAAKAAAEEARKLVREKEDEKKRRHRIDSVVRQSENVPLRRVESEKAVEIGSPKLHRSTIPKVLTDTTGESFTRAGLLVRTSSDAHRASAEASRRHRRETQPASSPLLHEVSGSGKGERPRRTHRSGDKLRDRSDVPSSSRDANAVSTSTRQSSRRHADATSEEQRDRPHRSRRDSERRDRRPSVKEKEKKTSFFGSLMKAFK